MHHCLSFTRLRFFVVVTIAVLMTAALFPFIVSVKAATLTSAKDTISDSRAGVAAVHTFVFTTPSTTAIKTIDFQFCTTASGTCTAPTGMILTASPTLGSVTGIAGSTYAMTGTSGTCTGTGNTACTATLTVTTPVTQTVTAVTVPVNSGITNPTTTNTTAFVRVTTKDNGAATIDTTTVVFATLTTTSIQMTASVDPTFTFAIAAVTSGSVNGQAINIVSGTSASTIPFGTLASGSTKVAAHDVTITTNATNGYSLTVNALTNPPLADGTNNIDYFTGTNATPTTWSSPAGSSENVNTGFVGYTTDSTTLSGSAARFSSNKWAGLTTTADQVGYSTAGAGTQPVRLGWQAEVNAVQPPGSYSGTIILVATPTY